MKTNTLEVLKMLKENNDFVSGEDISNKLGVSRTAIWKNINSLKELGYVIVSIPKRGYRLISEPDIILKESIMSDLKTDFIGREIYYYKTIDSTNIYAKKIANDSSEGTVVISEEQSMGKGRLGKLWSSPKDCGIYMSIILKPNINVYEAPILTMIAGLSISNALRNITDLDISIKWPNDIIINNKKVCGILTEMSAEIERINYIVLGMGINVNSQDFENDIA